MNSDSRNSRLGSKYHSILGLLAGSWAAQAITILSYPLLARLYSPTDFGIYGGVMGVVTVLTAVMRMRADKLILFSRVDAGRRDLILVFLSLNMVVAVISFVMIPLLRRLLPTAGADLLIIGVAVAAATSVGHVLTGILSSALRTGRIVRSQFLRSMATALVQIGLFFLAFGALGLMIGTAAGLAVALVFLSMSVRTERLMPPFRDLSVQAFARAMQEHAPRLFWGSIQSLAGSMTVAAPLIFAAATFPAAVAGLYVMADRIVRVPANLIATTIRSYVAVHARSEDGSPDIGFMTTISLILSGLALLIIIPLLLFGEMIFAFALGDRWMQTGSVAGIISIFILFAFAALPCQAFVQSLGRSRELIYIEFAYLAARVGPLLYWREEFGVRELAILVVLSNLLYNFLYVLYFVVSHKNGSLVSGATMSEIDAQ